MISRRSLFGLTFGGAVASAIPPSSGTGVWQDQSKAAEVSQPAPAPPMRITIGQTGQACKVEIGGVDVSHMCQAAHISARAGDVTTLHLEMLVLKDSEIVVEPGQIDIAVRNLPGRLRFEADKVRVKADV